MLSKARIKQVRALEMKKYRDAQQLFVAEGNKKPQIDFKVSTEFDEGFRMRMDGSPPVVGRGTT